MTNPARDARGKVQEQWPGATVIERGRTWIKHQHPEDPGRFALISSVSPMHIKDTDVEIDTAWIDRGVSQDPRFEMTLADYNATARSNIQWGDTIKYIEPISGANVIFQPESIRYVNQDGSEQYISGIQSVDVQVNDDILFWPGVFGAGRHFQWQAQTTRLQKLFIIDQLSDLPTIQPWLTGDVSLQASFYMKYEGASIWVGGQQWDEQGQFSTQDKIEFKDAEGNVLWWIDNPRVFDSDENETLGTFNVIRQSNDIYIQVRVPVSWINTAQFPIYIDPTVQIDISDTLDDGYWSAAGFNNATVSNRIGKLSTNPLSLFWRFPGVSVDGIINNANITFRVAGSTNVVYTNIYAEDSGNPAQITSTADGDSRILTTNFVPYDLTADNVWANDISETTPSLTTIVQELVDTYSLSNSPIQFFIKDDGTTDGVNRIIRDFSYGIEYAAQLFIDYAGSNSVPTVALDTPDEQVFTTDTPTVEFTGSDTELDDLRYNIQIADNDIFQSGVTITDEQTNLNGTIIHLNPQGSLTWEGYQQVDDRVGMSFQAKGGILDSVSYNFGGHETYPEDTDGSYLARVYLAEGYPVDPVPPAWAASTAYSIGDIVRPSSTANSDVHFIYRCTIAGTSGGTEPTWPGNGGVAWKTITPGQTLSDNTVTWEAIPGMHPVNPADPDDTPTPGWLAESVVYEYVPTVYEPGNPKVLMFEGANRIRLVAGQWYIVILDWRPNNTLYTNTIAVKMLILKMPHLQVTHI
jgi:hypothetical protein